MFASAPLRCTGGTLLAHDNLIIDNVVPETRQDEVVRWKRLLAGKTVWLEQRLAELRQRLASAGGA